LHCHTRQARLKRERKRIYFFIKIEGVRFES
jgi:hypothetical protein